MFVYITESKFQIFMPFLCILLYRPIGIMVKVFTNGLGVWDSIPSQIIPKTQKMVIDASLLNSHYLGMVIFKVFQKYISLCSMFKCLLFSSE